MTDHEKGSPSPETIDDFTLEADQLTGRLRLDLQSLCQNRDDLEFSLMNNIFRSIHTLKALCGMHGFDGAAELGHQMENLLDALRLGRMPLSRQTVHLLSESLELIISQVRQGVKCRNAAAEAQLERLKKAEMEGGSDAGRAVWPALPSEGDLRGRLTDYEAHRLRDGIGLNKSIHVIQVALSLDEFDLQLREISAAATAFGEVIATLPGSSGCREDEMTFDLLVSSDASADLLRQSLHGRHVTVNTIFPGKGEERICPVAVGSPEKLSVPPETMEEGETAPLESLFQRLATAGRKLARAQHKSVEISIEGGDMSLDRGIVKALRGPLLHIMRNAVDHGIELPQARKKAGKSEKGVIHLSAGHWEGRIVVTVEDDGAGLNQELIRKKARQRGFIKETDDLSMDEMTDLLCLPGFSTTVRISDMSGRGFGLDAVKHGVNKLKGKIAIESDEGCGTRIIIEVPLRGVDPDEAPAV